MQNIWVIPRNALSSTESKKFVLKIVEISIISNYLSLKHGIPVQFVAQDANENNWWITANTVGITQLQLSTLNFRITIREVQQTSILVAHFETRSMRIRLKRHMKAAT